MLDMLLTDSVNDNLINAETSIKTHAISDTLERALTIKQSHRQSAERDEYQHGNINTDRGRDKD